MEAFIVKMNCSWTLHVENFAKINSADIQLSPLLCFVGDNNSGKSYIMSLLWGILNLGKNLFPTVPSDSKKYKECEQWLKKHINEQVEITDDTAEMYLEWFNELLANRKSDLLKKIFNYEVSAGRIIIKDLKRFEKVNLEWDPVGTRYSARGTHIQFPETNGPTRIDLLKMNSYICWNILMNDLAAPLLSPRSNRKRFGEPIYFPASRSGFMLTYPQLLSSSLQTTFSAYSDEVEGVLTQPYIDFLQLITQFDSLKDSRKKDIKDIIDFIETNMIKGSLNAQSDYITVIKYRPGNSDSELPLHISSSVVSEISPILLTLKSDIKFNTMLIEEPEAHLHPALQKKMAQVIIRLVNSGIPIWITTHSDTILQHINNMIKLNSRNNKVQKDLINKFGYSKSDIIDSDDIQMYQFNTDGKNTTIISLEKNEYGFIAPTFNDALENTLDEVYGINDTMEEE